MKVYRISDRDEPRLGFYRVMSREFDSWSSTYQSFCDPDHHPCPRVGNDSVIREWWQRPDRDHYFFGFQTIKLMKKWILAAGSVSIQKLCDNKAFIIREYETTECFCFEHQCTFRLESAVMIDQYHFKSIFG